jgi:predicted nucleic acid-binding protein
VIPVLVDSGFIVALLDSSERHHDSCKELLTELEPPFFTNEVVIAEACHLLERVHGAVAGVLENVHRGILQIPYRLSERAVSVKRLMEKYADVPMDLADACLVDLADKLQTGRILTLDSDFSIYRWARNRPFEILINR